MTGSIVSVLCARILFCTKSCLKKNYSHKFFFPLSGLTSNSLLLNQSSFNSSVPLSLEHHLIISVIMPATPKVPPLHHNRTWPEQKEKKRLGSFWNAFLVFSYLPSLPLKEFHKSSDHTQAVSLICFTYSPTMTYNFLPCTMLSVEIRKTNGKAKQLRA